MPTLESPTADLPSGPGRGAATSESVGSAGGIGRRRAYVLAAGCAVVAATVGILVGTSGKSALPGGRIVSTTSAGSIVLGAANGSVIAPLPSIPGTGFLAAPDGRYLATGTGQEFRLSGTTLAATGRMIPFIGPPGSWRAVSYADDDQALVATEQSLDSDSVGVQAVTFSGLRIAELGDAESVAGDPQALGVFAVRATPGRGSGLVASGTSTNSVVERRDAGQAPKVLVTASTAVADLGENAETSVILSVIPDPKGDKIAVVVVPDGGAPGQAGIVVLSRSGQLLGAVRVANQGVGRPAWSPDGTSLAYDASTSETEAVAVWRIGHPPTVREAPTIAAAPATPARFDNCLWAATGSGFLCAQSDSAEPQVTWLIGRADGGSLLRVLGPSLPLAWISSSPS